MKTKAETLTELRTLLAEMTTSNYKYTQEEKIHILTIIARLETELN